LADLGVKSKWELAVVRAEHENAISHEALQLAHREQLHEEV
jgi:hypothetical protein